MVHKLEGGREEGREKGREGVREKRREGEILKGGGKEGEETSPSIQAYTCQSVF